MSSEEFANFQIWYAESLNDNDFDDAAVGFKFQNDDQIKLDYCVPSQWSKRRTDVTGVQNEEGVYPDTGPAGAFVEIQFTVDRKTTLSQDFLTVLINFYDTLNTDSDFRRGRIGLTNTDNPQLDITPIASLGYKMVQFQQIDPIDFMARQVYRVLLQRGGKPN